MSHGDRSDSRMGGEGTYHEPRSITPAAMSGCSLRARAVRLARIGMIVYWHTHPSPTWTNTMVRKVQRNDGMVCDSDEGAGGRTRNLLRLLEDILKVLGLESHPCEDHNRRHGERDEIRVEPGHQAWPGQADADRNENPQREHFGQSAASAGPSRCSDPRLWWWWWWWWRLQLCLALGPVLRSVHRHHSSQALWDKTSACLGGAGLFRRRRCPPAQSEKPWVPNASCAGQPMRCAGGEHQDDKT